MLRHQFTLSSLMLLMCSTTDWPLKNRGNFVKLVFEEANVPYKDRADFADIKSMMRSNKYGTQKLEDGGPYQAMVCPCHSLLLHENVSIWCYKLHIA